MITRLTILLTGAGGQLGRAFARRVREEACTLHALTREALDIHDALSVDAAVARLRPQVIVNAAAYTAVDRAEAEPEQAFAINRDGAGHLARAARCSGAFLVHISTDFVFDGASSTPYSPHATPNPLSVYGRSKQAGDEAVRDTLGGAALIVRTAWVYAQDGGNFVKTMLRLMAARDELRVVADQVGTPTWAAGLADCLWRAIDCDLRGVHHWTDAGVASWYDFAVAIQEEALALGLLDRRIPITPIATCDYPTPATRPAYSLLDKFETWQALGLTAPHWRHQLRRMLRNLQNE